MKESSKKGMVDLGSEVLGENWHGVNDSHNKAIFRVGSV